MAHKEKRGSGGNRKIGRSRRTEAGKKRAEEQPARTRKNKVRKLKKHLSLQPHDIQALAALKARIA